MQEEKTAQNKFKNLHIATRVNQVAKFIRQRLGTPDLALVLGSGLSGLKDQLTEPQELHYKDIPNMPQATVVGHGKMLIMGKIKDKKVLCWSGRVHGYQGYTPFEVSFIAYVSAFLNARAIIITNAAGGNNKNFKVGSIMMIKDYLHWAVGCPENTSMKDSIMGSRNFSCQHKFNQYLQEVAVNSAKEIDLTLQTGNYCFTSGPTFESFFDVEVIRRFEGYSLGMSTVPQVFGAREFKLNIVAFSLITNMASGLSDNQLSHEEVFQAANEAGPRLQKFIKTIIENAQLSKLSLPVLPENSKLCMKTPENAQNYKISYITSEQLNSQILSYLYSKFTQLTNENSVKHAFILSSSNTPILQNSIPLSSIPHFERYNKLSQEVYLTITKLNNQHQALLLYNVPQTMFESIESSNLLMILNSLKIQNVATILNGFSLSSSEQKGLIRIKDFCDRQYNRISKHAKRLMQRDQIKEGALLVGTEGPMYPTNLQRKGYREILKFDYFTVANLSLIQELEGESGINSSIWIVPSVDSNDFKDRQVTKEEFLHILESSKNQLKKVNQQVKKSQSPVSMKTQTKTIKIPKENNVQLIESAASELKKIFSLKDAKQSIFVMDSEYFELFKQFKVIDSASLEFEDDLISSQIYKLKSEDHQFYILKSDCLDVAGILSANGMIIPIKIARLAGFDQFTFLNSIYTPIDKLKGQVILMKDRLMWNMKNSLIGYNIQKWGPRFPDISDSNSAENNKKFEEIWEKETGKSLQKVKVMWSNMKKPYFGCSDHQVLNALGCQGYVKRPLNGISIVAHMKGKSLVVLCGRNYGQNIKPVQADALVKALLKYDIQIKV